MAAFMAVTIHAQPPGGGPGGPKMTEDNVKERVAELSETLELNEEQEEAILVFELEQFNTMQDKMEENRDDRDAMHEFMDEFMKEKEEKYAEVLNEEQLAKWKELEEKRRQSRPSRPGEEDDDDSQSSRGRGR